MGSCKRKARIGLDLTTNKNILSCLDNMHLEVQGTPVPNLDDFKSQFHYAAKIIVEEVNLQFTISLFNLYCGTIYVITRAI